MDFARRNGKVLAVAVSFAILAYGYALVEPSLTLDEEIVPTFAELGRYDGWSIALYRWGRAAFGSFVLAESTIPFLRPLLAILLLALTATAFADFLPTSPVAKTFFCLTFVTVPTFSFALTFSFMSVEVVLAALFFVLGLRCLVEGVSGRSLSLTRVAGALLFWVLAPSFYQDYGVVVSAFLVYLFFRIASRTEAGSVAQLLWFTGVLAVSVIFYFMISVLIARDLSVRNAPYLFNNLSAVSGNGRIASIVQGVVDIYFTGARYGTATFAAAGAAWPLLGASVGGSLRRRVVLAVLGVAICFAPFAYGIGAIPPLRASSGVLFVVAGAAAFAVARSPAAISFFVKCSVLYIALAHCVAANNIFYYESLEWRADKSLAGLLAQRIYAIAPEVHDQSNGVRVLFVGSYKRKMAWELPGTESWVGMFDTWGENKTYRRKAAMNYAGFPDFRLASEGDYEASLPTVASMPVWPAQGSVVRRGDLVIVKLGPANGFAKW